MAAKLLVFIEVFTQANSLKPAAMATPIKFVGLFVSLLLLISLLSTLGVAAKESTSNFHAVKVESFFPSTAACSASKGIAGFKEPRKVVLQMVNLHGPCSPLRTKNISPLQILQQDETRVASIQSRASPGRDTLRSSKVTLPASSGKPLGTGNFFVTVGFGTPKKDYALIFDTGSDLTWIQCEPCAISCYNQEAPRFDPSKSSTYLNISCNSLECSGLQSSTGNSPTCLSSTCVYKTIYGDQSYSSGYFARDTLTLSTSDLFPKFMFGCGQNNKGLFGRADGLLGLGRSSISLVSQTYKKFGRVFSYCIPSTTSSQGYLTFGAASSPSSTTKFTPLLTNSKIPSFYFLDLIGISVGGQRLTISPSKFSSPGTLIDSGTIITRLPLVAYDALKSAFRNMTSDYPPAQPISILDTCYNFTGYDSVSIPTVVLHFRGGADLNVDDSGIIFVASISQVCLAFAQNNGEDDVTIIGNKQQQRFQIIYDVAKGRVGFSPNACD